MIVLLMLWIGAGAAAGSTAAARAYLGSGNQLMQAERYAEAEDVNTWISVSPNLCGGGRRMPESIA